MTGTTEKAILAGGCFWGMQDLIRKRPGVISTRVGYTGGDVENATYRNHGTHAEAIEITFDPEQTSYRDLLEFFFQIHDPTTLNRQGNDVGAELPLGDLLRRRRAAPGRRGHDRRRRGLRPLARQGRHRGRAGRAVLGGRARAPGLPPALSERVHLPLRAPGLGAAAAGRRRPRLVQKLSAYDIPLTTLAGTPLEPGELRGRAALIVNVASRCGLTPQYEGLQRVYDRYRDRGLVVVGVPCDQFANQEPGSADEIAEFCCGRVQRDVPPDGEALRQRVSPPPALRSPHRGAGRGRGRPATWNGTSRSSSSRREASRSRASGRRRCRRTSR